MRRRLLVSTVGIALVVTVLLGVPMAMLLDRLAYSTARAQAERQAVSIGLALEPALVSGRVPTATLLEAIVADQEHLTIVTSTGLRVTGGHVEGSAIAVAAPGPVGSQVILRTSDDKVRAQVRRSWLVLLAVAVTGVVAAVALALLQSRRLSLPLLRLRRQAERIGAGDFTATAPHSGLAEIDAIARSLDGASSQIAGLVAAERSFSANASHQLRTALTGVVLRLDVLSTHPDDDVRQQAAAALVQTERLQQTVEDLLRLARTGRAGERRTSDLRALALEHVEDWRERFRREGRRIELTGTGPTLGHVSPGGIGEALDVLIDNARRHGAGTVHVSVRELPGSAELSVSDEGTGVADGFDVFSRHGADGHGLGLPLARALVEADGGSLELVGPRPPTFRIRVPAPPPASA